MKKKKKMKEWYCFVKGNANQKNLNWDEKLAAWLAKRLPLDLGYSLGNGIFVKKKNFVQFRSFVELKFGEFVEKLFFRPE